MLLAKELMRLLARALMRLSARVLMRLVEMFVSQLSVISFFQRQTIFIIYNYLYIVFIIPPMITHIIVH